KRLVENGLTVLTSLAGRSEETRARAKAAGMTAAKDDDIARRFYSFGPAARRCAVFCAAFLSRADRERCQDGLCRRQCHQSENRRTRGGGDRADGMPVRRCRYHRPAAKARRCRSAHLRIRRRRAALCELARLRSRYSRPCRRNERSFRVENV